MSDLTGAVNLLSCDGGGIRGVSELVILDKLMKMVQRKDDRATVPKPCEFFHLMGGTSTGGLVALMLGRMEMTTEEALDAYDDFAREIFSKRRRSLIEKYPAEKLEQAVQKLVHTRGQGDLLRDGRPPDARGRAFVCAMPEREHREVVCLRTYDIPDLPDRDRYTGVRISEAARATTAATTYFRPMALRDDEGREHHLVDAALGTNNPASLCLREAAALFGTRRKLGCVVSLGTGTRRVEMRAHGAGGLLGTRFLVSALKVAKEIGTDSEREHARMQEKFGGFGSTYYRFNVDDGAQGIALSDWKKMGELKERTTRYLQRPEVVERMEQLADVLLHRHSSDGLMLAHGGGLSMENTIPAQPRFNRRGKSSNTFTGREEILERLDKHFGPRAPGHTSRRQFQLRGMGGIGKTQIALKFTERNDRSFKLIMWVDATDMVTIEESFRDIATIIFGPGERKAAVQEVRRLLQQTDDEWLLVFDNAPASDLSEYLPDGDRGNVLYTTRHQNLEPRLPPGCFATVGNMGVQEAVRLMLLSARLPEDETSGKLARAIVTELGFLPLAIDQAGAYVQNERCPLDQYLGVFRSQREALLRSPRVRGGDRRRHIAVYACFNISYDAIRKCAERKGDMLRVKDAKLALKILRLICFYHNEGILENIFELGAWGRHVNKRHVHFPLRAGDVDLEEFVSTVDAPIGPETPVGRKWLGENWAMGMALLHSYSLIQFDYSVGYSNMHILIHDWARYRMDEEERRAWGLAARCLLMDSLSRGSEKEEIVNRRNALPHLQALLQHANIEHSDPVLESEFQSRMARIHQQAHALRAAETDLTRALELRKDVYGLLDRRTFAIMSKLASLYIDQGRYAQAADIALEVIDRRRLLHQESHWQSTQGRTSDVQRSEEPLDDIDVRLDTVTLLRALAHLDSMAGVEELIDSMVNWSMRRHEPHSKEAQTYQRKLNQARAGFNSKTHEDIQRRALEAAKQELEDRIAELGPDDPATIRARKILGWCRASSSIGLETDEDAKQEYVSRAVREDHEQELENARQEFHDKRAELGSDNPETVRAAERLGGLLDGDEAVGLLFDVHQWKQQAYGCNSMEAVDVRRKIAEALIRDRRPYEADLLLEQAILMNETILGKLHPETLDAYQLKAEGDVWKGDYKGAITAMRICLEGRQRALGPDHPHTRMSQVLLANYLKFEEVYPEWMKVAINNEAVERSKMLLGAFAPQWMKDWTPVSEDDLMIEHAMKGGFFYKYTIKVREKVYGVPLIDIEVNPQKRILRTLHTEEVEVDRPGDGGCGAELDNEILG